MSCKRPCVRHGRDLSGFCRLVVEPKGMDEKNVHAFYVLCLAYTSDDKQHARCITYGQQ